MHDVFENNNEYLKHIRPYNFKDFFSKEELLQIFILIENFRKVENWTMVTYLIKNNIYSITRYNNKYLKQIVAVNDLALLKILLEELQNSKVLNSTDYDTYSKLLETTKNISENIPKTAQTTSTTPKNITYSYDNIGYDDNNVGNNHNYYECDYNRCYDYY